MDPWLSERALSEDGISELGYERCEGAGYLKNQGRTLGVKKRYRAKALRQKQAQCSQERPRSPGGWNVRGR